jgi:hypothetical protein
MAENGYATTTISIYSVVCVPSALAYTVPQTVIVASQGPDSLLKAPLDLSRHLHRRRASLDDPRPVLAGLLRVHARRWRLLWPKSMAARDDVATRDYSRDVVDAYSARRTP